MFIIKYISNLLNIQPRDLNNFEDTIQYLNEIIEYSVTKKNIKSFLLFVYSHDTSEILHIENNKDKYKNWRTLCSYNYSYQIDIFDIYDLTHYQNNLIDDLDKKINLFLLSTMNIGYNKYFLKNKVSWFVFKKNIIKLKIKAIAKFFLLYYKVLHNRYKPEGIGYLEAQTNFEFLK